MAQFTPQQIEQFLQEFFDVVGSRQYVGARYVPVFGHGNNTPVDWDGGEAAYEPLSIVYHVGDTYTSRQYVPAGVDIHNTDYWVITGRYNAQVEQYRQEVLEFNQRITNNTIAIADETSNRENADLSVLNQVHDNYVPFPDEENLPKYGEVGQVLTSLDNGDTKWDDPVVVDATIAEPLIDAWLDDHPEAVTTVEDGAVTLAKLNDTLKDTITRVIIPTALASNCSNTNNSISSSLVSTGYAEATITATGTQPTSSNYAYVTLRASEKFGYFKNKHVTCVMEFIDSSAYEGTIVTFRLHKQDDWNPANDPVVIAAKTFDGTHNILRASFTPKDVTNAYADTDNFRISFAVNRVLAAGTIKFRCYVLVNDASSECAEYANTANNALNVNNGSVSYDKLDDTLKDTLTRVVDLYAIRSRCNVAANTITVNTDNKGRAVATIEVTNTQPSNNFIYVTLIPRRKYDYFKNRTMTAVLEFLDDGEFAGIPVTMRMTKGDDWNPTNDPIVILRETYRGSNKVMTVTFTPSDLSTYNDTDYVNVSIALDKTVKTGTLKIRCYIVTNDSNTSLPTPTTDILFWGDSLTAGAGGNGTTYPQICCGILGVSHINCGVGGESANTIAARQGGNALILTGPFNGTRNLSQMTDIFGANIAPLRQGNGSNSGNKLFINKCQATLSIAQSTSTSDDALYTIAGYNGANFDYATPVYFNGSNYTARVVVIWVGQNGAKVGSDTSYAARMTIIDSMLAHVDHDKCVVLGLSTGTDETRAEDDAAMLAHYGARFFPTRRMLVDYGLAAVGITPTQDDTDAIAVGTVPPSLRSDGTHLNASGYTALGYMVAQKILSLNYL